MNVQCPFCHNSDSRVVDTRPADDRSFIRRRRECFRCLRRFTTLETFSVSVVKRSGAVEPFSRAKIISGVGKACQGRPVSDDDLAVLAQQVEEKIRSMGIAQVDSDEVGRAILEPLRDLDEIAYLRFASVYSSFESLDDFERAINLLRELKNEGHPVAPSAAQAGPVSEAADTYPASVTPASALGANTHKETPAEGPAKRRSGAERARKEATGTLPLPSEMTTPVQKSRRKGKKDPQPPEQGTLIG